MADFARTYEFNTYGNKSLLTYSNEIRTAEIIDIPFLDFISHNAYSYAVPYYRPSTVPGSSSGTLFQGWIEEIKSKHPNKISGAIAINPAFAGKINNRREWKFWELVRTYGVSQIDLKDLNNTIIYVHDKDGYETSKTLSFLNLDTVEYRDISKSNCKPKLIFGKHHGIPLTKCFAESDVNKKEMIKFLEEIF